MNRRLFLGWLVVCVNGLIALVLAIPGMRYLLHPLGEAPKESNFLRVSPLSSLKPGVPFQATVMDDRTDAYTKYPLGPVGGVWLVLRSEDGGETNAVVDAFQVVCPHSSSLARAMPARSQRTASDFPARAHATWIPSRAA